jgi:transposase-like protein
VLPSRRIILLPGVSKERGSSPTFIWSAIDVDTKEILGVYASFQRSSLNTVWFMRKVLITCSGKKPRVLVDGGPWYPWALDRMGFEREHVTFGKEVGLF